MYTPSSVFRRTPEEREDQQLSWDRPDQAFFAAGACHVLAFEFVDLNPSFRIVAMKKDGDEHPSHVIATDGTGAFDHDGWTLEAEILAATTASAPGEWALLPVTSDFDTFCAQNAHRPIRYFHQDPRPRARAYINRALSLSRGPEPVDVP